ncbi:MAG: Lrp/AsnC family transcriptional regulator [Actinobacteria bacterium]|nr:MAG: Lrp/AsnC family transcriptional regulator [Actinomycetota bacterium]
MLDDREKELVRELQDDMPLVDRPYAETGERAGMSEDAVIETIEGWKSEGTIRRVGAILTHRNAGITANAMAVWRVPEEHAEEVGRTMAAFEQVSHCYQRPSSDEWPYNLYTMIHGRTREECEEVATTISEAVGVEDYRLLFTERELKKSSMKYFPHEHGPHGR